MDNNGNATVMSPDGHHNDLHEDLHAYLPIIYALRKFGQGRYENNLKDAVILYQQQLFFYSIRTLIYKSLKTQNKLWSLVSAIVAADNLNL